MHAPCGSASAAGAGAPPPPPPPHAAAAAAADAQALGPAAAGGGADRDEGAHGERGERGDDAEHEEAAGPTVATPPPPPPHSEPVKIEAAGGGGFAVPSLSVAQLAERTNSTTCPRQMLCDWNTQPDGSESGRLTFCNIEGYGGMCSHDASGRCKGATTHMLRQMGGRCPYPPGDRPGLRPRDYGRRSLYQTIIQACIIHNTILIRIIHNTSGFPVY